MLETFADKSINHFLRFVKDGVLDVDGLKAEGLNDAQIGILQAEFIERGLLSSNPIGGSYTLSTGETVQVGGELASEAEKPKRTRKPQE